MKHLLGILVVILMIGTSQASTNQYRNGKSIVISAQPRTVTRNVAVLVGPPRIPKFKLLRGNPHRITHLVLDNWDDDFVDDEDIITSYRRRDLNKIEHEDGISDNVRWRLFLARQLALLKHRESHN
jgi:hypothetical protein